jgi:RNA recognition motif-containing protein
MRLRGLPFHVKSDDIITFFKEYEIHHETIKIGRNQDKTLTGEGSVLFKDEAECKRAFREKQGQNIAHRWIELYQITLQDYFNFDQMQQHRRTVKLSKYLNESNISRVAKLRGLPFSVTVETLCEFFGDFGVTRSDIVLEENNGKKTGFALVFFRDPETAQQARLEKHKKNIG